MARDMEYHIRVDMSEQARSQDFLWGGAYLKNREQIINVGLIGHASREDTRAECETYGLTEIVGYL